MKRYVLIAVLMAMFFSTPVFSQEPEKGRGRPQKDVGRQLRLRRAQMEMEGREAELDFQRKMRELELERRKVELGRQRKPHKYPGCFKHCRKGQNAPLCHRLFRCPHPFGGLGLSGYTKAQRRLRYMDSNCPFDRTAWNVGIRYRPFG